MSTLVWIGIAITLFIGWAAIRIFERTQVYQPTRKVSGRPDDLGMLYEEIQFVAEDSTILQGWWVPADGARGTLLFLHGSPGNMGDRVEVLHSLRRLGLNLFTFDYRGYGESRGIPSEQGTYRDARAAFEVVRAKYEDADHLPVIVYGRSLGGAIAVHLAMDKPILGLILEGSFSSIVDMGEYRHPRLPVRWFGSIRYDSTSIIGKLTVPKIIAHSCDDELIPIVQARKLFESAADPKTFVELRGSHDQVGWTSTPGYWDILQVFTQEVLYESDPPFMS